MVDLLARHLYSGPRVFLRELLQNGVDAVAARTSADAEAPRRVTISVAPAHLDVVDTGIGLSVAEATELLSTIGRSSKRSGEEILERNDYIGRFGIGMLAAFMVAETIEVFSRSASGAPPIWWRGHDDGHFEIEELTEPVDDIDPQALPVGTRVRLRPRADMAHWFDPQTIVALATEFGELLPVDVDVLVPVGDEMLPRRITRPTLPWLAAHPTEAARNTALTRYAEETFGFTPLGHVDLVVPEAGLTGVAFILPNAAAPGRAQHRVYVKRMLLGDRIDGVIPEWAFFMRAVVNADGLNPTASREQLHTDEVLVTAQEKIAMALRSWAREALTTEGAFLSRFLKTHHLALRALAVTDDELLDLIAGVLPYETTGGHMTLRDVIDAQGEVLYATTTASYRRVADVAAAQDLIVVNAGYVYDADLLSRLETRGWKVRSVVTDDLLQTLENVSPERELEVLDALAAVSNQLAEYDCDVRLRTFGPDSIPAMLLRDEEAEQQRALAQERELASDVWAAALAAFEGPRTARHLVLNDASSLTQNMLRHPEHPAFSAAVRVLYLSSVLRSGEQLRSAESADLTDAIDVLMRSGLNGSDGDGR